MGKWTVDLGVITFTVPAAVSKGQLHCLSFNEWQKGGTRLVSWEAAGDRADATEGDERGSRVEARAGDLK